MANLQAAAAAAPAAGGGGEESLPNPIELATQIVAGSSPEYAMQLIAALEKALQGGGEEGAAPAPAAPPEAAATSGRISAQAARGQLA